MTNRIEIEITERFAFAGGLAFGAAGAYERLKGRAHFAVDPKAPVNTLGMGRIMFQVEDLREVLGRLQSHGAELHGEIVQYENAYLLCYVRGPEGILIALAEPLG